MSMTIDELLAITGLTASDEIPVWDAEATGEPTKKITAANLAASMAAIGGQQLTPSAAFSIPSEGNSVSYSMDGLTANHILTQWNFSTSAENAPPVDLSWTTANGSFTITNNRGTTSETIRPVFELPTMVIIKAI
jgi:hypothetical protein